MADGSADGAAARIGILGGTFDPPHCGHSALARGVLDALRLDRMLFMPTGNPNFKQGQHVTPAVQRVEMVRLALADEPRFELDEREVRRAGVTYTVDTLLDMRAQMPAAELYFVIGADSAATLVHWRRAEEFAPLCTFVAVQRPGYDFAQVKDALDACPYPYRMRYLQLDTPDVSSTQVRERAARGEPLDGLVEPAVADYIERNGLYLQTE